MITTMCLYMNVRNQVMAWQVTKYIYIDVSHSFLLSPLNELLMTFAFFFD